jgi:ribosomal protein S18 acetylase RimI-like enzyme
LNQAANVRLAQPADAALVASMLAKFRDAIGRGAPGNEEIEPAVERVMGEGGEYLLAFDEDGSPAGVAQFRHRWSTWHSGRDGWLEDLYVVESHRRLGVGRALVDEVIARAREHGCMRLELDVDEDNPAAIALYEALGFSDRSKGSARSLLMGRTL